MTIGYSENQSSSSGNLPPTLELNALAVKRGERVTYVTKNSKIPRKKTVKKSEKSYRVTLKVGDRKFIGLGVTEESGRHDAASQALERLKQLPITGEFPSNVDSNAGIADKTTIIENGVSSSNVAEDPNAEIESPVSVNVDILFSAYTIICMMGPSEAENLCTRASSLGWIALVSPCFGIVEALSTLASCLGLVLIGLLGLAIYFCTWIYDLIFSDTRPSAPLSAGQRKRQLQQNNMS